jgi:hypothetical protein
MTRTVGFVCCASLLAFPPMLASTGQKPAPESTPITRTATIEAIDKANRTVSLKIVGLDPLAGHERPPHRRVQDRSEAAGGAGAVLKP